MEINLYFERMNIMESMKEKVEIACGCVTIGVFIAVGMRVSNYVMDGFKEIYQECERKKRSKKKES